MEFIVDMMGVAFKDVYSQGGIIAVITFVIVGAGYYWFSKKMSSRK